MSQGNDYEFFVADAEKTVKSIGKETLLECLKKMVLIRNFETRAESAYLQGKVGGFFHSYIGQEAIQTAAVEVIGKENWWITTYRCHALALLLGATPEEIMAELYGKATGNAKGRGGSMHLYTKRLLGGFGIVGGQIPIAAGAAFTAKYQKSGEIAICFLGDGAVAQGAFHEALNIAALWDLPLLVVIENNQWGMGTAVSRAIATVPIAEKQAKSYGISSYTLDGTNFLDCYAGFKMAAEEVKQKSRPVLVEVVAERFKGHSISDPGLYRSKEHLQACMRKDPIQILFAKMKEAHLITESELEAIEERSREVAIQSMELAEKAPVPDPVVLGEDVYAP